MLFSPSARANRRYPPAIYTYLYRVAVGLRKAHRRGTGPHVRHRRDFLYNARDYFLFFPPRRRRSGRISFWWLRRRRVGRYYYQYKFKVAPRLSRRARPPRLALCFQTAERLPHCAGDKVPFIFRPVALKQRHRPPI